MSDWLITPHAPSDLEAIVDLVNSAYRGDGAKAGWTHESDYIDGQRTSLSDLKADLASATLFVARQKAGGEILACVMIERATTSDGALAGYIGMLTVKPDLQATGLGRVMLEVAEDVCVGFGAGKAQMTVVSIRDALIAWYQRRGYRLTGETRPFPYGDERFGKPRVEGLTFVVLEKPLSGSAE